MKTFKLKLAYDVKKTTCQYTFFRDAMAQKSMIDFFLISDPLKSTIVGHDMREDLINLSDHLPLTLALNMNILLNFSNLDQISMPSDKSTPISEKRLRWDHAPLGKYYGMTFNLIRPFVCIIDNCINALLGSNSDSPINDYICRSNILSHKASAILVIEEVYGGVVA